MNNPFIVEGPPRHPRGKDPLKAAVAVFTVALVVVFGTLVYGLPGYFVALALVAALLWAFS